MKPYGSNTEYTSDMRRLVDLRIDALTSKNGQKSEKVISMARAEMKNRVSLTRDVFLPAERVIQAFGLSELEEHLLFSLFLFEADIDCRQRVSEALKLKDSAFMSLEALAAFAFADISDITCSVLSENLLEYRQNGVTLKREIIRFIRGAGKLTERLWKEIYYPALSGGNALFSGSESALSRLVHCCLEELDSYPRVISVYGAEGSGRRRYVRQAAYENNIPVHFINCKLLLHENDFERAVDEIAIESLLIGSVICFAGFEHIFGDTGKMSTLLWKILKIAWLFFITTEKNGLELRDYGYYVTETCVPELDVDTAELFWKAETKSFCLDETANLRGITDMFRLTPAQIKQAAQNARDEAVSEGYEKIGQSLLLKACRDVSTKNISLLGKIIEPAFEWEDLILPPEQKQMLRNAISRVRLHRKVFNEWGFGKKTPYGAGVYILLYGPPGTGKTMAAQVLSRELGLSVYKIDLSAVMSKYIGETEKSLERVFQESQATNSILFFDEADALFGKRTEIKDSHDRHANLQVSFLLQKIEEHQGVVLLATNLDRNFDDAFKRRLHYVISFPTPDEEQRRKIWKNAFPTQTPVDSGVDFEYLAGEFRLSGGNIKNIALSAAFRAAFEGKPVGMAEIFEAVKEEMAKIGGVLPESVIDYMGGFSYVKEYS